MFRSIVRLPTATAPGLRMYSTAPPSTKLLINGVFKDSETSDWIPLTNPVSPPHDAAHLNRHRAGAHPLLGRPYRPPRRPR